MFQCTDGQEVNSTGTHLSQSGKIGWLVGCFGLKGPFSVYIKPSPRDGGRKEK